MRLYLLLVAFAALLALVITRAACAAGTQGHPRVGPPPQDVREQFIAEPEGIEVQPWVQNLEVPWSLVFLPDGRALVSERPGRIRLIEADGRLRDEPYATVQVSHRGEGGLMGLALHPQFPEQPFIYAMYTYDAGGEPKNRVVRLRHEGERAIPDKAIIENIPGHSVHNGGRLAFGPADGMLYITTGDIWESHLAQDRESLAGKVLRLTPDGEVPEDNPFGGSPIWSYGHRNPQGLAWHPQTGDMFVSEHGPSGEFGLGAMDVVRVVEKGDNVGWPRAWGKVNDSYPDPLVMFRGDSVPPGGIAFWNGELLVSTMRSEALVQITLEANGAGGGDAVEKYSVNSIERWFAESERGGRFGRMRDAVVGPDGALYVLTSNRDGRGRVRQGDDQILRITRRQ